MKFFSMKLLARALTACGGDADGESAIVGPCFLEYKAPIVNIDAVVGQPAGTELAEVSLAAITINGHENSLIHTCFGGSTAPTQAAIASSTCKNIRREDSKLICTLHCGFGTEAGERLDSPLMLIAEESLVQLNHSLAGISVISIQEDEVSAAF